MEAVEGRHPGAPFVGEREPVTSGQVVACAALVARPDFEARREDQTIDLVFLAVDDDAIPRDALDALSIRVDQFNVR